jgi:DNA-binding protein
MSEEETKSSVSAPENVVFVGNKPVTGYAMSAITLFQKHKEVILKARGKAISHAVDVAEVLRRRFMAGKCAIKSITTDTESVVTREGRTSNISAIEIVLEKIDHSS